MWNGPVRSTERGQSGQDKTWVGLGRCNNERNASESEQTHPGWSEPGQCSKECAPSGSGQDVCVLILAMQ